MSFKKITDTSFKFDENLGKAVVFGQKVDFQAFVSF